MRKLATDNNGFAIIMQTIQFLMNPIVLACIGIIITILAIDIYSTNPGLGYAGLGLTLAGVGGTITIRSKVMLITGAAGVIMLMLSFTGLV